MRQSDFHSVATGNARSYHISPTTSQIETPMPHRPKISRIMPHSLPFLFLLATFFFALPGYSQAVRIDVPLLTSGPNVPVSGQALPQALWLSNATVQVCQHPATLSSCTYVTTYTDVTAGTSCPPTQQLVQLPGNSCTASSGTLGNIGFWYAGGTVDYLISSPFGTFGPYTVTGVNGGGNFVSTVQTLSQTMAGPLVSPLVNNVINGASYATFDLALGACPGSGTCVIQFPSGTWTTTYYGTPCITRSNLTLIGAGMPGFDSATAPTKLVGGTIIEPGLDFCGASNVTVMNMGFDDGSAYVGGGGTTTNGLMFEGSSNGVSPGDATVQNLNVLNVTVLGSSPGAAVHGVLVEHGNSIFLSNINSEYNNHCFALKSSNLAGYGLTGRGCTINVAIIKTDSYTPNETNITIDGLNGQAVTSGDTTNGLNIDAEAGTITNVNASNITMNGVIDPLYFNNIVGNGAIAGVKESNAQLNISNLTSGSPGCVTSTGGGGSNAQIGLVGIDCINSTARAVAPLQIYNGWTNSSITDWKSVNAGYTSTLVGTFNISDWADLGTSAPSIPTFTSSAAGTIVGVANWSSTRGNAESSVSGGAVIGGVTTGIFSSVVSNTGYFSSNATTVIAALSTPVTMTTYGWSGVLHVRDNTNGGSAVFIVDPNGGVQLLGTSGITGLAAAQVTYSSGWHIALSSGSVPRTLAWTFYQ